MSETKGSSRGRTAEGSPNPIDFHVGNRVRMRRLLMGYSQEKLAELLGITFQQVQKYERGVNRISASRLFDISKVLEINISFFFEDLDPEVAMLSPRMLAGMTELSELSEPTPMTNFDPFSSKETLELIRNYYCIVDRGVAKQVFELIKAMATLPEENE